MPEANGVLIRPMRDAELAGRGVPVHTIDPAAFPLDLTLEAEICAGGRWSGAISGGTRLDVGTVRSVYYRKPTQFRLAAGMPGPEQAFAYGEARRGFGGVLIGLGDCRWVNDPVAAARCEYRPVQLAAAAAAGLAIPPTIITSSPQHAYDWATSLGRRSSTSRSTVSGTPTTARSALSIPPCPMILGRCPTQRPAVRRS